MMATPATDPMTIPAIAPPERPPFLLVEAASDDVDAGDEDVGVAVPELVAKVMKAVIVGSTTP